MPIGSSSLVVTNMWRVLDIKTGEFLTAFDSDEPVFFETEKEALASVRADLRKINNNLRSFAKSYNLPLKPDDLLSIKNYRIVAVTQT